MTSVFDETPKGDEQVQRCREQSLTVAVAIMTESAPTAVAFLASSPSITEYLLKG